MVENRKYLGFGIIGAAKGRQYSSAGVDKQVKFAEHFDLNQIYGGVLPPHQEDQLNSVLYRLTYKETAQGKILGIVEYRSAGEMGQTRPGSYLGAFIESVQTKFTAQNALFSALFKMSQYQFNHFIDKKEVRYNAIIDGQPFDAPEAELDEIANQLQNLGRKFTLPSKTEDLYIYLNSNDELVTVLETLLENNLFYLYENIYFSTSQYIYKKLKASNRQGIKLIFSSELDKLVTHFYQEDRKNLLTENQKINGDFINFQQQYQSLISQKEQEISKRYEYRNAENIKQLEQEKNKEIMQWQNDNKKLQSYIENQHNQLSRTEASLADAEKRANFADEIIKVIAQNKDLFQQLDIEKLPSIKTERENLNGIFEKIKSTDRKIEKVSNNMPKEIRKESIFTWLFLATSTIFAIILGLNTLVFNKKPEENVPKESQITKNDLNSLDDKMDKLIRKVEKLSDTSRVQEISLPKATEMPSKSKDSVKKGRK
ncbi:hypothetical protein [Avibacterium paragallinarum]|uniref:Uncharacterized protein n=1 Tax=Avibacterium paragallinarum TaxID=728 RepID=A0AAE5TII0_AVIPA|nr:hypothetical protein [Avibacterium paragallinarum]MEE3608363.1 hypothetical protein [Avibacterium paragallinarum]MEE3622218.1 hypothetical protein [Avibacterium paragallinarum]MEE3669723.1 hypothetical protein [Avibacterium paragallinarum]MEE3680056.1 hypothetical protein [Avibacterium paragallinarum]MEE4385155.1 hypothetical protein [Avibacterium paragallinarum]